MGLSMMSVALLPWATSFFTIEDLHAVIPHCISIIIPYQPTWGILGRIPGDILYSSSQAQSWSIVLSLSFHLQQIHRLDSTIGGNREAQDSRTGAVLQVYFSDRLKSTVQQSYVPWEYLSWAGKTFQLRCEWTKGVESMSAGGIGMSRPHWPTIIHVYMIGVRRGRPGGTRVAGPLCHTFIPFGHFTNPHRVFSEHPWC
jgi:hypothetical protein